MKANGPITASVAVLGICLSSASRAGTVPDPVSTCVQAFLQVIPTASGKPPRLRAVQYDSESQFLRAGDEVTMTAMSPSGHRIMAKGTCVLDSNGTVKELHTLPTQSLD